MARASVNSLRRLRPFLPCPSNKGRCVEQDVETRARLDRLRRQVAAEEAGARAAWKQPDHVAGDRTQAHAMRQLRLNIGSYRLDCLEPVGHGRCFAEQHVINGK